MAIQPVFENVRVRTKSKLDGKQFKVECKTEIPTDTVGKILDVSAFIGGVNTEIEGGVVKFNGQVIFNAIYLTAEGVLRKCECAENFDGEFTDANAENKYASVTVKTEKISADSTGTRLSFYAVYTAECEISSFEELSALKEGEGLIVDSIEQKTVKSFGVKKSCFPVEEQFELNYEVAEVLSHESKSVITAVQCGVGAIIIDGETTVSALLLQNQEKSDIIKEERVLPFRFELDYEEAMPAMKAVATVIDKSFKTDISVDEESKTSTVNVSISVNIEGEAFTEDNVNLAIDAFSVSENTEFTVAENVFCSPLDIRTNVIKLAGRASAEIPDGARIMAVSNEKVEILSYSQVEKGIKLNGVLSLKAYYRDGEDKNCVIGLETPFENVIDCPLPETCCIDLCAKACKGAVRIVSLTEAEISADVFVVIYPVEKCKIKYVKEITAVGEKPVIDSAISVYISRDGDSLYSLSKRLGVCPETLLATNKELQFPLTGKERIVIYRQK